MFRFALICGIAVAALFGVTAAADPPVETKNADTVTIPLDQIWAYDMPGTSDLESIKNDRSLVQVQDIRLAMSKAPLQGKDANSGFAVIGSGFDSLREAHAVLVDGRKPRQTFPQGSDVSVVFFSHQFGQYVHLHKVERRGDVVEIQYQFVPHKSKELTEHFALIPLGRLDAGTMRVEIVQSPMRQEFVDAGLKPTSPEVARRVVCGSFSITIVERGSD